MKDSESIKEFFSRVAEIVNQIRRYGDRIAEKKIVEKILRSLPPKFDHAAAAIEESKDLSKMSLFNLSGSLKSHEERIRKSSNQPLEQAFQSKVNRFGDEHEKQRGQGNQGRGQGNKGCVTQQVVKAVYAVVITPPL